MDPQQKPQVPQEVGHALAKQIIERIVVPMILSGLMELEAVISLLRMKVVASLGSTGHTKRLLALHLSRSERWVHNQLKGHRLLEQGAELSQAAEAAGTENLGSGPGYQLFMELMLLFSIRYPSHLGIDDLATSVDFQSWQISAEEVIERLELYADMGLLARVMADRRGPRFQATAKLLVATSSPDRTKIERLGARMAWVLPLAEAHCIDQGDFGGIVAELSPTALARARQRIRDSVAEIVADAIAETHKSDEETVNVRAIIAIGTVGGSNETK